MDRLFRFLAWCGLLAILTGFGVFLYSVASLAPPDGDADAIVVLTGARGARVETGLQLLEDGRGARLLISGVSVEATENDIRNMGPDNATHFDCCVDLDRIADDTESNARETSAWARENGYDTLLLVTHAYHMPRARLEMRRAAPELEVIPYPVGEWREPGARRLIVEYAKLLVIMGRDGLDRLQEAAR